jgi:ABC-type nitrate/sulfonate/bicarbonate transport system permease component
MTKWRIDRTSIFLSVVGLLFLWDLAYFMGLRDPARFPHPFDFFQVFGDFKFLRGFGNTLRRVIVFSVLGYCVGIGIASLVLRSSTVTKALLRFLRLGVWFPFLVFFAVAQGFIILGIAAVTLSACYQYLVARFVLMVSKHQAWTNVAREAVLQAFFFVMISEFWLSNWLSNWIVLFQSPAWQGAVTTGFWVCIVVVGFLFVVNWCFRFSFNDAASMRGAIVTKELKSGSWYSLCGALVFVIIAFVVWQLSRPSALEVVQAGVSLFKSGEIWWDIRNSILEVLGGVIFSGSVALVVFWVLSTYTAYSKLLFLMFPLTYISPIVTSPFWLFIFYLLDNYQYFSLPFHRLFIVGSLAFYPLLQVLWGLREQPLRYRILLAVDDALPIAFVAMLLAEVYAATAGLGFLMVIASTVRQTDKGLVGFILTVALLVGLSSILRSIAKRLYLPERSGEVVPVEAS